MEILHEDDIRGLVEISATRSAGSFEWSLENKAKGLKLLIWGHGSDIIGESIAEALEKNQHRSPRHRGSLQSHYDTRGRDYFVLRI